MLGMDDSTPPGALQVVSAWAQSPGTESVTLSSRDSEPPPTSPMPPLPCQGEVVRGLSALSLPVSHVQAEAVAAFESRRELVDGTGKVILVHGSVLLLLDSFRLREGRERRTLQDVTIYGSIRSPKAKRLKSQQALGASVCELYCCSPFLSLDPGTLWSTVP